MDRLTGSPNPLSEDNDYSTSKDFSQIPPNPDQTVKQNTSNSNVIDEQIIAQAIDFRDWVSAVEIKGGTAPKPGGGSTSAGGNGPRISLSGVVKGIGRKITGKKTIEILDVDQAGYDSKIFQGAWVDLPKRADTISGSVVEVAGWVMAYKIQPIALRLVCNEKLVTEIPINIPRPDVSAAYCVTSATHIWGYDAFVNFKDLPSSGKLQIKAVFPDGVDEFVSYIRFSKY